MRNFILGFLIATVIGGVVVATYFMGRQESRSLITSTPTVTSKKDASLLNFKVTPTVTPSPLPQQNSNDAELIKQALIKKNNWTDIEVEVTLTYNDGIYAKGGVREKAREAGGGYFFAKKVNGEWKIVTDGNGAIACESLIPYPDYPASLIPECYEEESGITKKR